MTVTLPGILGALAGFIAGLVTLSLFYRAIYPVLSFRHETLKVTQAQGPGPSRLVFAVQVIGLVVMPALGYFAGQIFYAHQMGAT